MRKAAAFGVGGGGRGRFRQDARIGRRDAYPTRDIFERDGREHAVRVIRQMPAGEIHVLPRQMRRADAVVAGSEFCFFRQFFQFLDDGRPVWKPEREAGADVVVEGEKLQLFS